MAAIATLLETVPHGGHVVALDTMYYGTRDWLQRLETKGRIALTLFDPQTAMPSPVRCIAGQDRSCLD